MEKEKIWKQPFFDKGVLLAILIANQVMLKEAKLDVPIMRVLA